MTRRIPHIRNHGFTLVEMVVVLLLLSVVAALAIPRMKGFLAGRDVREEGRRLLSLTHWARGESVSRGVALEIWIDPEGDRYGIRPLDSKSDPDAPSLEFSCDESLDLVVDEDDRGDDGLAAIRFWPDGGVDAESVGRVELRESLDAGLVLNLGDTGFAYRLEDLHDVSSP